MLFCRKMPLQLLKCAQKTICFVFPQTFYPNFLIFLHRYICHICDIMQLWKTYNGLFPHLNALQGFWEDNRKSLLRFLGESHRGVKGFVKDENFAPIEGASMKVGRFSLIPIVLCIYLF